MNAAILVIYAGLVGFVSLRPGTGQSIAHWDKFLHLAVYFVFALLGYRAIGQRRAFWLLCLGIAVYGGLLEWAQSYTPGRFMSVYDMLANTLGVLLGAAVVKRWR